MSEWPSDARQDRRDRKRAAERARVPKHGRNIAQIYQRVVEKRLREQSKKSRES